MGNIESSWNILMENISDKDLQYIGRKFVIKIFALKNFKININQDLINMRKLEFYCNSTNIL